VRRLNDWIEKSGIISEFPVGFRKGRTISIFILRTITDTCLSGREMVVRVTTKFIKGVNGIYRNIKIIVKF
jgi:hypothetical protein